MGAAHERIAVGVGRDQLWRSIGEPHRPCVGPLISERIVLARIFEVVGQTVDRGVERALGRRRGVDEFQQLHVDVGAALAAFLHAEDRREPARRAGPRVRRASEETDARAGLAREAGAERRAFLLGAIRVAQTQPGDLGGDKLRLGLRVERGVQRGEGLAEIGVGGERRRIGADRLLARRRRALAVERQRRQRRQGREPEADERRASSRARPFDYLADEPAKDAAGSRQMIGRQRHLAGVGAPVVGIERCAGPCPLAVRLHVEEDLLADFGRAVGVTQPSDRSTNRAAAARRRSAP